MHVGNYLREIAKKKRFSVAELAQKVNKSDTAVRKDFEKDSLHMSVLDSYAQVLGVNIYKVLSRIYDGKEYDDIIGDEEKSMMKEEIPNNYQKKDETMSPISVTFQVDPSKKDELIRLLTT
ncbi:hypothetical protein DN752_20925 [Echinicola strongylocentroti]|uniref:HTH cro/C1-type domain-containing protein n=1 Tax=Echinicola strongylocentroti TaxID=1795355 RepID=A0A2Z4IPC9_9BACT|nr:helix-turn-helix transcriptional regulator [Echinicola strongylocentroti]AWW32406.1 hypothetical protein DN752_20925 [Echinicola strongylocentroti]